MTFLIKWFGLIPLLITGLWMNSSITSFAQAEDGSKEQENLYIKSIYFGGGSYYVDELQTLELVDFILEITDLREYEIEIHGHTDNIGGLEFNQWLSEMRSAEVLDIISELELDKTAIQGHDFGEESPYYDNRTWDGKLSNRRVDVIIRKIVM